MADSAGAIDLSLLRNPFSRSVIADAWAEAEGDVAEINREPFEECLRLLDSVAAKAGSTGLVVTGYPGAGKTHLLARLRGHLAARRPETVFVYARLESSASHLRRFLRRRFVEDLLRPAADGRPHLEVVLAAKGDDHAFAAYLDRAGFSFNLSTVLRSYREGKHRRLCAQWLAGDALSPHAIASLGLGPDTDDEDALEDEALRLIANLARLNAPHPVVFCGDQVEALEAYPGDLRGLHAYVLTAAALHDAQPNLLVVSCMQSAYYEELTKEGNVRAGFFRQFQDRIWKHRANLRPINWAQARTLLRARLALAAPLAASAARGSLWPLQEDDFRQLFGEYDSCEVRRAIHHAEQVFEGRRRGGALPAPESPRRFLERRFEALRGRALGHGAEGLESVLAHGLPKLLALAEIHEQERPAGLARAVDLAFGEGMRATAVSFCHQSPSVLPRRLKRILDSEVTGAFDRLVLIRPAALPVSPRAAKTQEYLAALRARGARLVQPSPEAMAALDALRSLLADAQSGELTCAGQTLESLTVAQWLTENLPEPLYRLLEEIAGEGPEETPASGALARNLLDYVAERYVVPASEAAEKLQSSEEEIFDCARHCSGQLGVLAGPPAVLFAFVAEGFADESH